MRFLESAGQTCLRCSNERALIAGLVHQINGTTGCCTQHRTRDVMRVVLLDSAKEHRPLVQYDTDNANYYA